MVTVNETSQSPGMALDDYDNVIGFIISRTAHSLNRRLNEAFAQGGVGLRAREFPVVNRLHQFNALTQTELCELTYPDHPAMTRMLDRLIKAGFVQKKMAASDRRAFRVSLTPRGAAIREQAAQIVVDMLEEICAGITPEELVTTVRVMHRIQNGALAHESSPTRPRKSGNAAA